MSATQDSPPPADSEAGDVEEDGGCAVNTQPPALPLEELLRKAHRAELLSLANTLGIRPRGLGLAQLADHIGRTLRRRGGHELSNLLLRRGEGPPYPELLAALARRCQVPSAGPLEQTEQALLRVTVERAWATLSPSQRATLWAQLHGDEPVPEDGPSAMAKAETALGTRFSYALGSAAVSALLRVALLVPPFPMLAGCLTLLWITKPRDDLLLPAVLEVVRLRQAVKHRVTIGVVGSPSCGKDAAIAALFGVDSGNIDPVAGSTREVEITQLPGATALFIVNTPGLGDVVASVTEEARQVLDHVDVYLYLINAQGGVQAREQADYQSVLATGRPLLAVVNKIDTLRPEDRERFMVDAKHKLGAERVVAAAFDPLPQLADAPIGLDAVRDWVVSQLIGLGKQRASLPVALLGEEGSLPPA